MRQPVIVATWRFGRLAVEAGLGVLMRGGSALDAVEIGANAVEEDPSVLSVGFGGLPNAAGEVELDAVQVNTPDHLHAAPTVEALRAGLDVVVPKPTAATVKDAHDMIQAAKESGRILGIDFHKREDPRIKEAEARYQSGRYGTLQAAVFYMLDKLFVADPNHAPRFFASPDFAARNTPISFLTVHMADALMKIVNLVPVQVRAVGYAHKLPSLKRPDNARRDRDEE